MLLRIDFYIQHLERHGATGIELISDRPVRFLVPQGERKSNAPIDHGQVVELIREAAPVKVMEQLRREGLASFTHYGPEGTAVDVEVATPGADSWRVMITPASRESTEELRGVIEPAAEQVVAPPPPPPQNRYVPPPPPPPMPAAAEPERDAVGRQDADRKKRQTSMPPPPAPAARAVTLADGEPAIHRFLRMMSEADASDLHLSSGVAPIVRLDGEMQALEAREPLGGDTLSAMLYEIAPPKARADFEARRDTDFSYAIEGVARFRINCFVDRRGVGAVFRRVSPEVMTLSDLGLPDAVVELCWLTRGLVLVTGPSGSGRSTTLTTLIDYVNEHRNDHVITVESPIEFLHDNRKCLVNQREVGTHTESYAAALDAALREDPDVVMVADLRDLETTALALELAETGHLVFATMPTASAIATVDRVIEQYPVDRQPQIRMMLASSLRGVISQTLCRRTGGGRVAAFELLVITHAAANMIRERKTEQLSAVMQTGKALGMQTLNDHLLSLVRDGQVGPEEAYGCAYDKEGLRLLLASIDIRLPSSSPRV